MKDYELYARKYPSIMAMTIPALLTTCMVYSNIPTIQGIWSTIVAIIETFIPIAVIYGAVGFFARQLFRSASKLLFQFPMFKEDETDMPTTQMLLWTSKNGLSKEAIKAVSAKVKTDFDIILLTEEQERANIIEAKKTIVDAVGKIREATRSNPNLLQYNIDFGFCRNYLGASVYSILSIIILTLINVKMEIVEWSYFAIAFMIQIMLGLIVFMSLKYKAAAYSRALYNAYLSNSTYQW